MSSKKIEKKLREIQILKEKKTLTPQEVEKIQKEKDYKNILKSDEKVLEVLPDDVQRYILEFMDTNTRLKYLFSKYSPNFVKNKLSLLSMNKLTLKRLYSCQKYIMDVVNLNKDWPQSDILKNYWCYLRRDIIDIGFKDKYKRIYEYPSDLLHKPHYYFDILKSIITTVVQNYTKIVRKTNDENVHLKIEKNMIKLFSRISSM